MYNYLEISFFTADLMSSPSWEMPKLEIYDINWQKIILKIFLNILYKYIKNPLSVSSWYPSSLAKGDNPLLLFSREMWKEKQIVTLG